MQPPTSRLPPIKFISTHSPDSLRDALAYLRSIYNPPVRGSRLRRTQTPTRRRATDAINDPDTDDLDADALRTDTFERSYTIKWLTALTAQSELSGLGEDDEEEYEKLIEDAASLLAICAGTASAGVITRRFVFDLVDPVSDSDLGKENCEAKQKTVTVDLKDVPLDNHDYGSVGAQTWGGACVMAEMIAADPRAFGLCSPSFTTSTAGPATGYTTRKLRCLELGAGTGLVSLAAGKVVEQLSSSSAHSHSTARETESVEERVEVEIVATDYYPSVLANLEENVLVNFPGASTLSLGSTSSSGASSSRLSITTHHLDWSSFSSSASSFSASNGGNTLDTPLSKPFDVIYGADIIYEALHATWIKGCLRRLLRKPLGETDTGGIFHLIIPSRSTHAKESGTVETVFGGAAGPSARGENEKEDELVIKQKETIVCDADSAAEGDEVVYAYYRIGWNDDPAATDGAGVS